MDGFGTGGALWRMNTGALELTKESTGITMRHHEHTRNATPRTSHREPGRPYDTWPLESFKNIFIRSTRCGLACQEADTTSKTATSSRSVTCSVMPSRSLRESPSKQMPNNATNPVPLSPDPLIIREAALNCPKYGNREAYSSGTMGFSVEMRTRKVFIIGFVALGGWC